MFCASALIKLFFLFELFYTTICDSSGNSQSNFFLNQEVSDFQSFLEEKLSRKAPRTDFLNKEVEEFQNFLGGKLSNQDPHTNHQDVHQVQNGESFPSFSNDDWDISSVESGEFSLEDVQDAIDTRSNEEPQITSAGNVSKSHPLQKREDSSVRNDDGDHEVQGRERKRSERTNNRPLEILLIRESDSNSKDPMADIVKEVLSSKKSNEPYPVSDSDLEDPIPHIVEETLSQKEPIDKSILPKEPYPISRRSFSMSLNEASSPLRPDVCSVSNHSFYDRQICSSGYQYKLEPHLTATFADDLKAQMLERYSPPKQTVCGFQRRMNPNKDVTERALCPFQWKVSERNPSRIPEYLYEAKCSCTDSCAELKSKIRVLWRVGCEDQLHVYREGWEEIAVACVPTKPPIINSEHAHRIIVTAPP